MKKLMILLAFLLTAMPGLKAQTYRNNIAFDQSTDFSFGTDPFTFEALSYLGWGVHMPTNEMKEAQSKALNSEFFLNIIEMRTRLYRNGLLTLGVDWDRDCYRLDRHYFWMPLTSLKHVEIVPAGSLRIRKSNLVVHTFSFPMSFEHRIGEWVLRFGGALDYNLPAKTRVKAESPHGDRTRDITKGIPTRTLTYHLTAALSYGGMGLYARYNPLPQFEEGVGPQYRAITFGLIWGLGM